MSAQLSRLRRSYVKRAMFENATLSFTTLTSIICRSATIHVIIQEVIPWELYHLSEARTPDSLEPCRINFGIFASYAERVGISPEWRVLHMTPCRVLGVLFFGVETNAQGCKRFSTVAFQLRRPSHRSLNRRVTRKDLWKHLERRPTLLRPRRQEMSSMRLDRESVW